MPLKEHTEVKEETAMNNRDELVHPLDSHGLPRGFACLRSVARNNNWTCEEDLQKTVRGVGSGPEEEEEEDY